ncbi:MAG: glycosyl hydrolase 53 family protein [Clostridia bacterium]|nr:glycosyl hydrolase 53 family protein [Clostridia bacterium]
MKRLAALILSLSLLLSLTWTSAEEEAPSLFVRRVDLPEGFFLGMDVSSVLSLEAAGVVFRDEAGAERDLFELLAESGVNLIRVRVWNDPFDADRHGYGGGNNDLQAALTIGRRATEAGMRVLIDFHYSDFWADPAKQQAPKAWEGLSIKKKIPLVKEWTLESLTALRDAGVDVAMVQLGNETNGRLCGEKTWMNIYKVMNAGAQAVREIFPEALIAVHFANPENAENYLTFASKLDYYQLDYDVFGTSYYPYWHGTLENLKTVLSTVAATYGKKVMVLETSYAWTAEDGDFSGNTIGEGGAYEKPYPFTVQGQVNEVTDVAAAMAEIGGIGVCYWEGAWVPVGTESWEKNHELWEAFGAGWASSYAGSYDPDDAGKYYGGCACDNQTFFDFSGKALPSLQVFRLMREGQDAPLAVDALDEVYLDCDLNGELVLPETVPAVMSDNSRQDVPVTWEAVDAAALKAAGPAKYTLSGVTEDGRDAVLHLNMVKYNFVVNGSFEDPDSSMWQCVDLAGCEQLYNEEKRTDSLSGTRHWHFYSPTADSVDFELFQDITGLPAGRYTFSAASMGGDAGDANLYLFVRINGELTATAPTAITSWNVWHTAQITGIEVQAGDTLTVGIHVTAPGAGAWGKIDDFILNSEGE